VFPGQGREAIAIGPRARLIETKPAADFALHGGRLFYIDRTGVFEADPGRVKWRRARC
jgi:hypothetical protein